MYDFGLTDDRFWDLTPAQFNALSDRFDSANRRQDFRFANLISVLANIHRDEKRKPEPFTALDFMPRYDDEPEEEPKKDDAAGGEAILAYLKAAFPPLPQHLRDEMTAEAYGE